jgi:Ca2+-binding EF-hand superfamily protein
MAPPGAAPEELSEAKLERLFQEIDKDRSGLVDRGEVRDPAQLAC